MFNRGFWFLAKSVLAVFLVYMVWKSGHIDISVMLKLLDPVSLLLICSMIFTTLSLASVRFYVLCRQVYTKITFKQAFKLTFIGSFFNYFLPGGTGGDVVRGLMLAQSVSASRMQTLGTVLLDRILGLFTVSVLSVIGMSLNPKMLITSYSAFIIYVFVLLSVISCLSLYILMYKKRKFDSNKFYYQWVLRVRNIKIISHIQQHLRSPGLSSAVMLSLVSQAIIIGTLFLIAKLAHLQPSGLYLYLVVTPVGLMLASLPITPAGIGLGQLAFLSLFKIYTGQVTDTPATLVSAYQIVLLLVSMIGMYFYLTTDFRILKRGVSDD